MSKDLNPTKALIFRIIHRDNVPWILDHGLHCRHSSTVDAGYVGIGNSELIAKRDNRAVEIPPGGTLGDYIPFYFTPFSPMMYNIKTGHNGIRKRPSDEIVILVSSLHHLKAKGLPFLFTDRHAYLRAAVYLADLVELSRIDWPILQRRDFKKDDIDKFERYQAEALVHRHMPVDALLGMGRYNSAVQATLQAEAAKRGVSAKIVVQPSWYL